MFNFSDTFKDDIHQPFIWQGDKDICAILVHGFPGTPSEMRPIAEVLHASGWTVQGLLLPGFGIEIDTIAEKTYDDWLAAVINAVETQAQQYSHIVLVGLSMGGALSIQASTLTNISALLLLAPFWKVDHILWKLLPVLRLILPNFKPFSIIKPDWDDADFRNTLTEWLPDADLDAPNIRAQVTQFAIPTNMINQIRIAGIHARQAIPHVTTPTTVIQGRQDELVKADITQKLIQQMRIIPNYILLDGDHNLTDTHKPHWAHVKSHIKHYAQQVEAQVNHKND
jgi:carboxylesterase